MKKTPASIFLPLYAYDEAYGASAGLLCGVDEAGRGPLAGDVFAAAVVLDPKMPKIPRLNDSKQVTARHREEIYAEIQSSAMAYSVRRATVQEIWTYNILGATRKAMRDAINDVAEQMKQKRNTVPNLILIDGNRLPSDVAYEMKAIVKGDATSAHIAAASILAKVERDRDMQRLAEQYPEYHFEKNKGYATKEHIEAIQKYGPLPVHRLFFLKQIFPDLEKQLIANGIIKDRKKRGGSCL